MQPGSLLECIKKDKWNNAHIGFHNGGPKFGEIVTHDGDDMDGYIYIREHTHCPCGCDSPVSFWRECFREIQPPMSIPESLFNQSPEKVTV